MKHSLGKQLALRCRDFRRATGERLGRLAATLEDLPNPAYPIYARPGNRPIRRGQPRQDFWSSFGFWSSLGSRRSAGLRQAVSADLNRPMRLRLPPCKRLPEAQEATQAGPVQAFRCKKNGGGVHPRFPDELGAITCSCSAATWAAYRQHKKPYPQP